MNHARPLRSIAALVSVALAIACSDGSDDGDNRPPVVDAIEGPSEVMLNAESRYDVPMTVKFHDPDTDPVTRIRIRVAGTDVDKTGEVQDPKRDAIGAEAAFSFGGGTRKQTYDLVITVFDARGAESAEATKPVTLK